MSDSRKEQELFLQVLEIEDPGQRDAVLRQACAGDLELLRAVQDLLSRQSRIGNFLQTPAVDAAGARPAGNLAVEAPGTLIGRYKLLEQIGEGGFGVVYLAEQREPVRRKVALKIIKLGMDTRQVIARFEAERQALALMDHPSIAKVLDAGSTETGRPYFVMELVRGIPITKFCEENRLTIKERLELFIPVCQAIQHAHQKGIIHRDIKPSNILVTMSDGVPHPMVIDFGVAKAIGQRLTEKTLHTRFAQMIGTPAYMSPEQAEMSQQDVDTRTDVYSLGILLYELLTGTTPFSEERLREAGYAEIQRIISQEEAVRPSTALSRLNGPSRSVAASRRCEPASLMKLVKGDLDWIAMKCLEKDRTRRYETANGLAMDLQRHLRHEPVIARPPSRIYQVGKFVRRHRVGVGAGFALALTILLGAGAAVWQAVRATRAERLAEQAKDAAEQARTRAEEEHARAEEEAQEALRQSQENEAVHGWLVRGLLELPAGVTSVGEERRADITLREALLEAGAKLGDYLSEQPRQSGRVSLMIGKALQTLNEWGEARKYLRRAYELLSASLGANDPHTLDAQSALGSSLAYYHYRPSLPSSSSLRLLGDEGLRLLEDAYVKRKALFGKDHPTTLHAAFDLGICYGNGAFYGGEADLARAEALVPEAAVTAGRIARTDSFEDFALKTRALEAMSWLRQLEGRIAEARELTKEALALRDQRRRATGEDTPYDSRFARYWWNMSWFHLMEREYERAAEAALKGLEISTNNVGNGHPTGNLLLALSTARRGQGRFEEAAEAGRRYLEYLKEAFGPQGEETLLDGRWVIYCYTRVGDWAGAGAELVRQRECGFSDGFSLAYEILIRYLAGETNAVPQLRQDLWQWMAEHPQSGGDYPTALALLVLPIPESELSKVLQLAQQAVSSAGASGRREQRKWLLQGLVAYRRGQLSEAVDLLLPLAHNLHDRRIAALSRFHLALAMLQEGRTAEAEAALEQANDLLSRLLRDGNLEPVGDTAGNWCILAGALVARDSAERQILGRVVSEPVNAESLAAARATWKPVHELLNAMDDAARAQDYAKAHRLYIQARAHPAFELETAEVERDIFSQQFEHVAAILVHADARDDYVTFLNEIYRENTTLPGANYLIAGLISPWELPAELRSRIRTATLALEQAQERDATNGKAEVYWRRHHLGVAFYRLGRYKEALEHLKVGMETVNHGLLLSSTAHAALVAWKLGRAQEARAYQKQAEEGLAMRLEASNGRLDPNWLYLSLTDLALKEARELMGKGPTRKGISPSGRTSRKAP